MTETYVIDVLLIAIVIRQMIARPLTPRSALIPVALILWAWFSYFKPFALQGNDLVLIVIFALVGALLGTTSGLTTRVWHVDGRLMARSGAIAAATWIAGMGFRLAFQIWANSNSGTRSLTSFSLHHDITTAQAWVSALLLMAVAEVLGRVGVLQWRRVSSERRGATAQPDPALSVD